MTVDKNGDGWIKTREKVLLFLGVFVILFETINAELFTGTFHIEILIAGLALCGVSITQWGR